MTLATLTIDLKDEVLESEPLKSERRMSDPEIWVEKHGNILYRYAFMRVRDSHVAEELVQETFLAALRGRERFKGRSSERTWLIGILRHKIFDHFRKISREQPFDDINSENAGLENLFDRNGNWLTGPSKWPSDPGKYLEQKEFLETLHSCLSGLQQRLARAFVLREIDGFTTEEICDLMNISANNLGVMVHRARIRLRHCLELKWFADQIEEVSADETKSPLKKCAAT
jgi:RNA polymerase sigma-70 factor (ECF subfamily)